MNKVMYWADTFAFNRIGEVLDQDQPIITTTDTVLGLLSRCNQESFIALNECKGRYEKPYLIMAKDVQVTKKYVSSTFHERLEFLAHIFWPGPMTMIFPAKSAAPFFMKSAEGKIAFRVVTHPGLYALLEQYEILFSTSANKAGESTPSMYGEINPTFLAQIPLIVLDKKERMEKPSTIIDCSGTSITIVREGMISRSEIESKAGIKIS